MPLLAPLAGLLMSIAGSLVGRVLLALGLSFVTYTGFNAGIDVLLVQIKGNMSAMPSDIISFLAWLGVDKAIGMLFSAYAAAMVVKSLGGAGITKLVRK